MVWKEKIYLSRSGGERTVRAANAPYGELHTSINSRSLDHERGMASTPQDVSGLAVG